MGMLAAVLVGSVFCWASLDEPPLGRSAVEQRTTSSEASAVWKRRQIPGARMSVELPGEPERASVELKPGTRQQIASASAARLTFGGVLFRFAFADYGDEAELDLARAADAAIANLRSTTGISELRVFRKEHRLDGVAGILVEASYQYFGSPVTYRIHIAGSEGKLWQASAMFKSAVREQEETARRVLESVRLDK